jgi:hypothetical protein
MKSKLRRVIHVDIEPRIAKKQGSSIGSWLGLGVFTIAVITVGAAILLPTGDPERRIAKLHEAAAKVGPSGFIVGRG